MNTSFPHETKKEGKENKSHEVKVADNPTKCRNGP